MNAASMPSATPHTDCYPSRTGLPAQLLERIDPVVYAPDHRSGPISQKQIAAYGEQGYLVLEDIFSHSEVTHLQNELQKLRNSAPEPENDSRIYEPGDNTLRSIFAIHQSNGVFARLASDRRLLDVARFLLDDEVYIHQSRLNYKPGFRGKEFYWHSDFETWHVEDGMPRMRALSMSITLTENTPNNGPLMLIPESHKQFVVCDGITPRDHFRKSLRKQEYGVPSDELLHRLTDAGGIVAVDAKPGSVIIFDCNTLHGSNGNITPLPRSNAFVVYNALSNKVGEPYCNRPPRPEYICTRNAIAPLQTSGGAFADG